MSQGWIKLHRQLLEWEWYDDINACRLFVHCLLRANHSNNKWRGIDIKRGSFITSLESLNRETGLSVSQIRTALKKLISTGELASKSQAKNRVITVLGYDSYQQDDKQTSKLLASKSQGSDRIVTTNKNDKKENNDKECNKFNFKAELLNLGVSKDILEDWLKVRKTKKATNTKTALNTLIGEARKAGISIHEAVQFSTVKGWAGFKASWFNNDNREGQDILERSANSDWHLQDQGF